MASFAAALLWGKEEQNYEHKMKKKKSSDGEFLSVDMDLPTNAVSQWEHVSLRRKSHRINAEKGRCSLSVSAALSLEVAGVSSLSLLGLYKTKQEYLKTVFCQVAHSNDFFVFLHCKSTSID